MNRLISIWLCFVLVASSAFVLVGVEDGVSADTIISGGSITIDTTWTLANSPYIIGGNVYVDPGVVLTIEPGVVVKFDGYYSLVSNGAINATGNQTDRIIFTSNKIVPMAKDWYGVVARENGTLNIDYCNITYANVGVFLDGEYGNPLRFSNISNTYIAYSDWYGMYFEWAEYNNVINNTFYQNNNCNFVSMRAHWNNLSYNNASHARMGIAMGFTSNNNTIFNNNLSHHWGEGIDIDGDNNTVSHNDLWSNKYGISSWFGGNNNEYTNNTIFGSTTIGFSISGNNIVDVTNMVNNHPVFYYYNLDNQTIDIPERAGTIIISDCEYLIVNNCHIENADYIKVIHSNNIEIPDAIVTGSEWSGISLLSSNENHIEGGNFSDNQYGIMLYNHHGGEHCNIIENCDILNNQMDGINLRGSSYNSFINNTIENNIENGVQIDGSYGISAKSSGNIFTKNKILLNGANGVYMFSEGDMSAVYYNTNNNSFIANNISMNSQNGILLESLAGAWYSSSNNIFTDNNITSNIENGIELSANALMSNNENIIVSNYIANNSGYGIFLTGSEYNEIYHNFIDNNVNQAYDDSTPTFGNVWDSGYPGGGNCWSDYVGVDNYNGINQDIVGPDYIGDTPYNLIDGGINQDNYPILYDPFEKEVPISSVSLISPYSFSTSTLTIIANADDGNGSGIGNVNLWSRHSFDNISWGTWESFKVDYASPWSWNFIFSSGGYFEFFSIATDITGNIEPMKNIAEALCHYNVSTIIPDEEAPYSSLDGLFPYWQQTNQTIIKATANDMGHSGINTVSLWYRYCDDNLSWGNWTYYRTDYLSPWSWEFDLSDDGFYEFYSISIDNANNEESPPYDADICIGYDTTPPISDAGPDQLVLIGDIVTFSSYGCLDNVYIVNYSWDFNYNGTHQIFDGESTEFIFWTSGNYTITLNVTDAAGNWDTDTMIITVESPEIGEIIDDPETPNGGIGNYLWLIIILIIAAVLGAAFMLAKKPQPVVEEVTEEPVLKTELCPKCGFDIEAGSACPFCVEEKPPEPEPPKPAEVPKPKPKFTNEEMLEMIEKSYREGKLSEEQYLRNMKKFS